MTKAELEDQLAKMGAANVDLLRRLRDAESADALTKQALDKSRQDLVEVCEQWERACHERAQLIDMLDTFIKWQARE